MPQKQYPNPESGRDFIEFPYGIDLVNDYLQIAPGRAERLNNMDYRGGKLRRRSPFTSYSTETYPADISRVFEYVDASGTSRLLLGSMDGKVKERTDATSHSDKVTGLSANKRAWFASLIGAVYHQNGEDSPRRGDAGTWRVAGGIEATTLTLGSASAGALTGDYIWIVTACVKSGSDVILESLHSNQVVATLSSEQQALSWSASGDARVNWYRLYRVKAGQGSPLFLVYEANATSYTDNIADSALPEQIAPPSGRNGPMPVSRYMAVAGQRLCCGYLKDSGDSNASKAVHVSVIARNQFDPEYFPTDGIHKFYLPGKGPLTAIASYSVKDEEQNNRDLFLSQGDSCYVLRSADPNGKLETISTYVGAVNNAAVITWDRNLFFVSRRGLEFLGGLQGTPILISEWVNPFFEGGGSRNYTKSVSDTNIELSINEGKLLVFVQGDSANSWGDRGLILDLDSFNPMEPLNPLTTKYTTYESDDLGMATAATLQDGTFVLVDNQNNKLLTVGVNGGQDYIGGTDTEVKAEVWSGALMQEVTVMYKKLRWVNVLMLAESNANMGVFFDRGLKSQDGIQLSPTIQFVTWDKVWDKEWAGAFDGLTDSPIRRDVVGRALQVKFTYEQNTDEWVFIGLQIFYTDVKRKRIRNR